MKFIKIILSFLLMITVMTANVLSIQAEEDGDKVVEKHKLLPERERIPDPESDGSILLRRGATFPTKYSSVEKGYVTNAKNQGNYGTCWAFAACSAAETSLIKKGLKTKNNVDLSEAHLAYYFYNTFPDFYGNTKNDKTNPLDSVFYNNGGNHILTIHGIDNFGFADETVFPYGQIENAENYSSQTHQYKTSYILKNAYNLDSQNKPLVKQAIQDYGSVVAMYYSAIDENEEPKYYNTVNGKTSYYNPERRETTNHAITIVGWDDAYSRNNFSQNESQRPKNNGAWLVKNSWGDGWGDNGYFWMSYDEVSLCNTCVYDVNTKSSNEVYQYDGSASPYLNTHYQNEVTIANIYKTKNTSTTKTQKLSSVSFGTDTPNLSYTIKIYGHLINTSQPTSGSLLATQSGKTTYVGMHNVKLNSTVYLGNASSYSIVITLKSTNNRNVTYWLDSTSSFPWISFINNTNYDYSYVNSGYGWVRLLDSTARIKGYAETINKTNIYGKTFSLSQCTYTGSPLKSNVVVKDNGKVLVKDKDYRLAYLNNTKAGTAYVVVTGMGNYAGTRRLAYTINKKNVSTLTYSKIATQTYTGKQIKPSIVVKHGTKTLKNGTDYTLSYGTNKSSGKGTVKITGKGNYTGTITKTFTIAKRGVSKLTYSKISNKSYTGKQIKPSITVKYSGKTLKKGTDYTVSYGKNKSTGKGTVKIIGKGNYTGSITKTFYIVPKKVTISSAKSSAKKKITVKYKKVTGASGYQIAYQKSGSKKWTYTTVSSKSASKTLTKLTSKKNYKVKVRAYKTVSGKKYYGTYSATKTVKVK